MILSDFRMQEHRKSSCPGSRRIIWF